MKNIKTMKLYKFSNRFINEYNNLKKIKNSQLDVFDFSSFDNLHYHGEKAVCFAINKLNINKDDIVLDIGSGVGGPARIIAYKTKCKVDAIEIQKDLSKIGERFSKILGMTKNVNHLNYDFHKKRLKKNHYNHVVCWLSLYHLKDRKKYLRKVNDILKVRGNFYIEDFYIKNKIDLNIKRILSNNFFANSLVSKNEFFQGIEDGNFVINFSKDMTSNWIKFTNKRLKNFLINKNKYSLIHDKNTLKNLEEFYSLANYLLNSGALGGIRLNCVKNK